MLISPRNIHYATLKRPVFKKWNKQKKTNMQFLNSVYDKHELL